MQKSLHKYDVLRVVSNFNCNQRCMYCYQTRWDVNYLTIGMLETRLKNAGINPNKLHDHFSGITVMGGEPRLNPHLHDILEFLRNRFQGIINLNVDTNLSMEFDPRTLGLLDRLTIDVAAGQHPSLIQDTKMFLGKMEKATTYRKMYPNLTLKFNLVTSTLEELWHREQRRFMVLYHILQEYENLDNIMVTVCQNFLYPPHITRFMEAYGLRIKQFIKSSGVHLMWYKDMVIGYLQQADFEENDLIIWRDGYTDKFEEYLQVVNPELRLGEVA